MIVYLEAEGTNAYAGQFQVNFWDLMFLLNKDYYYYMIFFPVLIFSFFFFF